MRKIPERERWDDNDNDYHYHLVPCHINVHLYHMTPLSYRFTINTPIPTPICQLHLFTHPACISMQCRAYVSRETIWQPSGIASCAFRPAIGTYADIHICGYAIEGIAGAHAPSPA